MYKVKNKKEKYLYSVKGWKREYNLIVKVLMLEGNICIVKGLEFIYVYLW